MDKYFVLQRDKKGHGTKHQFVETCYFLLSEYTKKKLRLSRIRFWSFWLYISCLLVICISLVLLGAKNYYSTTAPRMPSSSHPQTLTERLIVHSGTDANALRNHALVLRENNDRGQIHNLLNKKTARPCMCELHVYMAMSHFKNKLIQKCKSENIEYLGRHPHCEAKFRQSFFPKLTSC